jgi:hypothetical protein
MNIGINKKFVFVRAANRGYAKAKVLSFITSQAHLPSSHKQFYNFVPMLTTQTNTAPATPPTTATPIASINPVAPFAAKSDIALPGVEEGELEEPAEEGAPEMSAAGLEGVKGAVAVGAAVAERETGNRGGGVSVGRTRRRG